MNNVSVVEPVYIASASQVDGRWDVHVSEWHGSERFTVVDRRGAMVDGDVHEPWKTLTADGWVATGPIYMDWCGLKRRVEPPSSSQVTPLSVEECIFIRRCSARGVPSVEAAQWWRSGKRDPLVAVAEYAMRANSVLLCLQVVFC